MTKGLWNTILAHFEDLALSLFTKYNNCMLILGPNSWFFRIPQSPNSITLQTWLTIKFRDNSTEHMQWSLSMVTTPTLLPLLPLLPFFDHFWPFFWQLTTFTSFSKLKFRWSFWGAELAIIGSKVMTQTQMFSNTRVYCKISVGLLFLVSFSS